MIYSLNIDVNMMSYIAGQQWEKLLSILFIGWPLIITLLLLYFFCIERYLNYNFDTPKKEEWNEIESVSDFLLLLSTCYVHMQKIKYFELLPMKAWGKKLWTTTMRAISVHIKIIMLSIILLQFNFNSLSLVFNYKFYYMNSRH